MVGGWLREILAIFYLLILRELEISLNIAIKQPEGLEVEKFFPRETELEKLRNAREFFLKEKIWEKYVPKKEGERSENIFLFNLLLLNLKQIGRHE